MRTKHAREIRKGLLVARNEVRARRENDFGLLIESIWAVHRLEGLSQKAFDRSWRKKWPRPLRKTDEDMISGIKNLIEREI